MTIAPTPPMGWNSWDCYGTSVTEAEVLANADFMAQHLLPHGWDTVVVDIQWYEPAARAGGYNHGARLELDRYGRPLPAVNRFPSAAGGLGFKPLADRIHALGLKFGLHIMRGIPRQAVLERLPVEGTAATADQIADTVSVCSWNADNYGLDHSQPAAQAYYDSQLRLFAAWGVDFVKADDMLGPYFDAEIAAYRKAMDRCGRDMVLSLSPGRALSLSRLDHLRANATMWRVSDDLWDVWEDVEAQFARMARWAPHQRPGGWADADMLPVGRIAQRAERGAERLSRLTADEQRTMLSLWCIARSPLMIGCDLPSSPPETLDLLTNTDLLAAHRTGSNSRELLRDGDLVVWAAESTTSEDRYAACFNTGTAGLVRSLPLADLGLPQRGGWQVREAWSGSSAGISAVDWIPALEVDLPAHGVGFYTFSRA
ncbi:MULTISPECIES: glycoside hydrolase family 27 protein [unclassified Pseudarthrobacter]|uniref:glycoside hydrolase family 27 protein n=1 Tax=unclassified Pseudarthrobacter TaxID=2647000 RepID=UPI003625D91F